MYAVARGRKCGVFHTWEECEKQVKGYSGARYKKFTKYGDAWRFIQEEGFHPPPVWEGKELASMLVVDNIPKREDKKNLSYQGYALWTDGSASLGVKASYGYIITRDDNILAEGKGSVFQPPFSAPQAELCAVEEAFTHFRELFPREPPFTLYSDSEFVISTFSVWGPKRTEANWKGKAYAETFQRLLALFTAWKGGVKFKHVPGHAGIRFNEYVDKLAASVQFLCIHR